MWSHALLYSLKRGAFASDVLEARQVTTTTTTYIMMMHKKKKKSTFSVTMF